MTNVKLFHLEPETLVDVVNTFITIANVCGWRNVVCEWREKEFANNNYLLEYPLWQITYETLLDDLEESGVTVTKARHALY